MRRNKLRDIKYIICNNIDIVNECWIYRGYKDKNGYPNLKYKGKTFRLSRLCYLIYNGRFDKSKIICHTCDNPSCVNPEHLWIGTYKDNALDRSRKGRTVLRKPDFYGCVVTGCTNKHSARRMCKKHYTTWYRENRS